jgi:hypothetical protein
LLLLHPVGDGWFSNPRAETDDDFNPSSISSSSSSSSSFPRSQTNEAAFSINQDIRDVRSGLMPKQSTNGYKIPLLWLCQTLRRRRRHRTRTGLSVVCLIFDFLILSTFFLLHLFFGITQE